MDASIRRINIKIEIDRWDWKKGSLKDTLDITTSCISYRFQKTIKTPKGSCQLQVVPQMFDMHILDALNTMDVIRIYEFGDLKFIGYITRIAYSGSIGKDGKPNRSGIITVAQFGGLLVDASIGMGIGTALGVKDGTLQDATVKLQVAIANAVEDGTSYSELIKVTLNGFRTYLEDLGGINFTTYIDEYLIAGNGLDSSPLPILPRSFEMYGGMEQTLTFWATVEQLVEKPFNEFFIDNGPRSIYVGGKPITLNEKANLIFRETPFDGSIGKSSITAFQDMEAIYIDKHHLTQFDLSLSMDEVYTVYSVKASAFTLNDIIRQLTGLWTIDEDRIGKYLFKPLITEEYYTRIEKTDSTDAEPKGAVSKVAKSQQDAADTLLAWFSKNDEYLSGAITHMVPENNDEDPKIGDKITVYGIPGSFYVEGIAHTWTYQGVLSSNLTVTRGYNDTKRIEMTDKIFSRNRIR